MKTRLKNAEIRTDGNVVRVTTRTAGHPSDPQPNTITYRPHIGQTVNELHTKLAAQYTDENGE